MLVELERNITADVQCAWDALSDVESFAALIDTIDYINVVAHSTTRRTAEWSVMLRGAHLRWRETAELNRTDLIVTFEQESGDLSQFEGAWTITSTDSDAVVVRFRIEFEIGIPMLASILNPIAEQELRRTCESILDLVEKRVSQR